jgi:hypothetical protein
MNMKKLYSTLILLLIVGTAIAFAITNEEYNFAYKQGYIQGYTMAPRYTFGNIDYIKEKKDDAMRANARAHSNDKAKRDAYGAGFSQGWDDNKAERTNRYLSE